MQVPVSKAGKSLSFTASGDLYLSGTITLSLPSGLSASTDGICLGGVRNGVGWLSSFTFNGRSFSFAMLTIMPNQQPYQLTVVFSC